MINTESSSKTIELDTDVIEITEQFEPYRVTRVKSTKRSEEFQIVKAGGKGAFFKILYQTGKQIPNLAGHFTSTELALHSLLLYLANTKPTKNSIYKERWGDAPVPQMKQKKRISKKYYASRSTDIKDSN